MEEEDMIQAKLLNKPVIAMVAKEVIRKLIKTSGGKSSFNFKLT